VGCHAFSPEAPVEGLNERVFGWFAGLWLDRVLNAEMDDCLDGEAAGGKANRRNGYSAKTVTGETVTGESSKLELRIPRDHEGTFDPKLIAKYQRRYPGFDAKIIR
jgi:putative transposase